MPSSLGVIYTDLDDLMFQWQQFAVANGWTLNLFTGGVPLGGGRLAISKGTIFAQWEWDDAAQRMFHFQSLAYDGSIPGDNPDDAGPGGLSGVDRATVITNASGVADFFQGTEAGEEFLLCITESDGSPLLFRYWGLGKLIKVGTWTGGEFLANQSWPAHTSISASQDAPFDSRNHTMFDALGNQAGQGTTLHIEGVHAQAALTKWGEIKGSGGAGVDRAGEVRSFCEGAEREGMWFNSLNQLAAQPNNGFIPLKPWPIHYREGATWTLLGFVPGMRGLKMTFISPREEFTLGGDTWKAYPWVKKSTALGGGPESGNEGWAVLKTP
jgi:hypothetical protein